jgi:hypothetical protein
MMHLRKKIKKMQLNRKVELEFYTFVAVKQPFPAMLDMAAGQ